MKKRSRLIKWQRTNVIHRDENKVSISPYWDFVALKRGLEPLTANPDNIGEEEKELDPRLSSLRHALASGALKRLTPKQRTAFTKIFDRNMTFKEAGKAMGISKQRVYVLFRAAIVKIRKEVLTNLD